MLHRYVGKGLRGFPQSHIVGKEARHATCAQILQPIETLLLIRPQRRGECGGRSHSRRRPAALELARIVADRCCIFPARRRQGFEVEDACRLGCRQHHCARRGKPPGIGHLRNDREELCNPLRRQCHEAAVIERCVDPAVGDGHHFGAASFEQAHENRQ